MNASGVNAGPTAVELALLRDVVRDAMRSRSAITPDEQWPQSWIDDWDALDELGLWSTIEKPDGSLAAAAVVAEEMGRALYPGPVCEALTAAHVMQRLPDCASLRTVADGSPAAMFVTENSPAVRPPSETLLIVATVAGNLTATTAAELEWSDIPSLDVTRRIVQMHPGNERAAQLSSADADLPGMARAVAALLCCADSLGCIEHVVARAAEYANQRSTFGSPIGKYQAVAHRLVDHAIAAQEIRLLLDAAIRAVNEGTDDVALRVATVETSCHGRSSEIISDCIQLAGAIGFTWEFGHHFYVRRVVQNVALGGGWGRPAQRLAGVVSW
jgi:alkylation response protein AidB-like acyl-CoA dehydrogenase